MPFDFSNDEDLQLYINEWDDGLPQASFIDGNLVIPTPKWAEDLHAQETPYGRAVRYRGAWGGRGSSKSHEFAGMVVERMVADPDCSVICIREIQKSLAFSAKRLIEHKIKAFGVGHLFDIQKNVILRKGGDGVCLFQGMQDHTAESVKSLEGFDIAWVEEANSLSHVSMMLLRPTIRKPGSELWFSWNPDYPSRAVEELLRPRGKPREDALVVGCSYKDNPFLPETLRLEAETDRLTDTDTYNHVWLGMFQTQGSKVVIPAAWVDAAVGLAQDLGLTLNEGRRVGALDVAGGEEGGDFNCYTARAGQELYYLTKWNGLDTTLTTTRAVEEALRQEALEVHYDCVGLGEGVTAAWADMGRRNTRPRGMNLMPWSGGLPPLDKDDKIEPLNPLSPTNGQQYHNLKAQGWMSLRRRFHNAYKARKGMPYDADHMISIHRDIEDLEELCVELSTPHQETAKSSGKTLVDKQPDGAKSPNRADSVMMSYHPAQQYTYMMDEDILG